MTDGAAVNVLDFGLTAENSPFGRTGIRLVAGENRDAHYGWGSIVEIAGSTKWVMIYRKATSHGIEDGAEVRSADSHDFGESWVNDRQVQTDATTDSRPDKIALMANGRIGFFCNRGSTGTNKFPLFIYSDDGGVTWTKDEIPTGSISYTFAAVGGIIDFPLSQGGNDTMGFVSFGYIDAGGVDAFTTVNNGDNWSTTSNVNGSTVISENVVLRIGTQDKWLIYVRDTTDVSVYATTNLLSWGTSVSADISSLSTPPAGFYDSTTDKIYYIATARAGKEVDGFKSNLLYVGEDSATLWANNGVFTAPYKNLINTPNWGTGYLYTFQSKLGLGGVFTAGENKANGLPPSSVWMIGNFETKGSDIGTYVDKFTRNMYDVNLLEMEALDNVETTCPLKINNLSKSAYLEVGAYAEKRNLGGGDYTYTITNAGNVDYNYNVAPTIDAPNVNYTGGVTVGGFLNAGTANALTIASGVVTATQTRHTISTEAGAATDDLDTINGGTDGDLLILNSGSSSQDSTLKDGTGNLRLAGDFTLDNASDTIVLLYHASVWKEISRASNA
tara:strand:+ start:16 stop:1689 length:1674 start_codon:yes stop_codon:yes gene_type:complete